MLQEADVIYGHNIIGYDNPCVKKLYAWWNPKGLFVDKGRDTERAYKEGEQI